MNFRRPKPQTLGRSERKDNGGNAVMENLLDLCNQLGGSFFALRKAASNALQKGKTRALSYDDSQIILLLHDCEVLTVREISKRTHHDLASTSRMISNLAAKGFVQKIARTDDKRQRDVVLTSKGKEADSEIRATFSLVLETCLRDVTLLERREMQRLLHLIVQASHGIKQQEKPIEGHSGES